jgi:PPE-repeat protein
LVVVSAVMRAASAMDEAINPWVLGALTPEIAALNLEYFGFMWPNNAAAGVSYGAALDGFGAALMAPAPPALSGASPSQPSLGRLPLQAPQITKSTSTDLSSFTQGPTPTPDPPKSEDPTELLGRPANGYRKTQCKPARSHRSGRGS